MRDRLLAIALALLVLLLFVGAVVRPAPEQKTSFASSVDQGNFGYAVFYHYLEQRSLPVQSQRLPWNRLLTRYGSGHVLLSNAPYLGEEEATGNLVPSPNRYVSLDEADAMLDWIAAGNTLVLADALADRHKASELDINEDLLRKLGWRLSNEGLQQAVYDSAASGVSDADAERIQISTAPAPQALHQLRWQFPGQVAAATSTFEYLAWEPQAKLSFVLEAKDDCDSEETPNADDAYAAGGCGARGITQAWPLLVPAQPPQKASGQASEQAFGWIVPLGRGQVVALSYGRLWSNQHIHQQGVAAAGETLLKYFVRPGGKILFDDYRYGLSDVYDTQALWRDPRLYKTIAIALLFWLLYVVGRNSRLLPPRLQPKLPSNLVFAEQSAHFLARHLTDAELAQNLLEHFFRRFQAHCGISSEMAVQDPEKAWSALTTGFGEPLARRLRSLADGRDNRALLAELMALEAELAYGSASAKLPIQISFSSTR